MNESLRDLYQEVILDHGKRPRNFHAMEEATAVAEGFNPLCGDRLNLYLRVKDGVVEEASFQGRGCAISTASASMMTQAVKGKTEEEVRRLFDSFHNQVTGGEAGQGGPRADLGKLAVFAGVREFPTRIKCAVLAWHTLKAALSRRREMVTTE
ncbi:MAG: Fe-S cluster assembly sulfur transfer protein SufU [Acidobacteriota bacterium]